MNQPSGVNMALWDFGYNYQLCMVLAILYE